MQAPSAVGTLMRDVVLDVVRFPFWWYTVGLARAARFAWGEVRAWGKRLSLIILFRNMFKPMFGDTSRSGRAISIFMRLVTFVFRLAVMIVWSVFVLALVVVWIALPAGVIVLGLRALGG